MSMDDQEIAARFAAIMLGGELSDDPPPEGSGLFDLNRLCDAVERGEITEEERYAEMQRQQPNPTNDPTNRLDPRHPDWRMRWGPLRREP
jgi:hypothetical protein